MQHATRGLLIALVGTLIIATPGWAARTRAHEAAESDRYGRKAGGMIGRGLINASTCFVDLLVNTVNETKAGPPLIGTLVGIGKGAGCTTLRLGSGAVDIVTFWVPGFNGFPVSDSYANCLAERVVETAAPVAAPVAPPTPAPAPAAPAPKQWDK